MEQTSLKTIDFLMELIKSDMVRIGSYGATIIQICITILAASFAISAFLHRKDNNLDFKQKRGLLLGSNIFFLTVVLVMGYFYFQGLDANRVVLELRQTSLVNGLANIGSIKPSDLYPNPEGLYPTMSSWLEKIPVVLTAVVIIGKGVIEWLVFKIK